MMKSWADHCSSDEESDDGIHHPARVEAPTIIEKVVEEEEEVNDEGSVHEEYDGGPPPPVEGDYSHLDLPSKPPFTAHLSNLNFKIKDEEALCHHVENMVDYRYRMRGKGLVHAINARFGTDRATGSRKGFGYVDVQSVDELILLLDLNDGFSQLLGRPVRIELAQSSRNKKDWNHNNNRDRRIPDVDGSKFQGGRYSNRNNNNNNNNNKNNYQQKNNDTIPNANKQRPTLKLKPRSTDTSNGSNKDAAKMKSNIFGGAKPRDESTWSENKNSNPSTDSSTTTAIKDNSGPTESNNDNNKRGTRGRERLNSKDGDRKMSNKDNTSNGGRGRGGRGRGGKGGGKGENGKQSRPNNNRKTGKEKERKKTDDHKNNKPIPAQKAVTAPETVKKPAASLNAFAALGFDSDSD